jgi:NAD-dependent dihydropyrimidine dehydrogenase PreA subunit
VDCLTIATNGNAQEIEERLKTPRLNKEQPLYVSASLKHTGRVMLKDENLCVHCGLCAERCPTSAWDMQKSTLHIPYAADEAQQGERAWQKKLAAS